MSSQVIYFTMPLLHISTASDKHWESLHMRLYSTIPTGYTNTHTYCAALTMDILCCASGVPVCCRAMIWANSEWGKKLSHSRRKSEAKWSDSPVERREEREKRGRRGGRRGGRRREKRRGKKKERRGRRLNKMISNEKLFGVSHSRSWVLNQHDSSTSTYLPQGM